jgi:CHAT domain-containing protein
LTLSACNTASGGGRNEKGIEVEGMAALVAQQGAASVLASLWPVSDSSTAELMQGFYAARTSGAGLARAAALRQAQLGLLHGRFAHPFHWAPFVILGSWL